MTEPKLAAAEGAPESAPRPQRWPARTALLLRRHWLVSVFLAAGLVLRVLAKVAYNPALIYVDTLKYLYGVYPGSDPLGYRALLKVVLAFGGLPVVAVLQSLLGLAVAVTLYVVLLWRPVVSVRVAVAAGLILGLSATFKAVGEVLVLPAVLFLLASGGGWRRAVGHAAALAAAFAVPILAYCTFSYADTGHFWLARQQ